MPFGTFSASPGLLCMQRHPVWQSQPTTANSESVRKRVQFPPRNNQDNFCPAVLLVGVQITCCKSFLAGFTSAACPSPPPLVAGSALYFPRDPVLGFNSDQTRLTSRLGAPPPLVAPLSLLLFHGGRWARGRSSICRVPLPRPRSLSLLLSSLTSHSPPNHPKYPCTLFSLHFQSHLVGILNPNREASSFCPSSLTLLCSVPLPHR